MKIKIETKSEKEIKIKLNTYKDENSTRIKPRRIRRAKKQMV